MRDRVVPRRVSKPQASAGSQFTQYINPLLAVLARLGGSARAAEARAAVADLIGATDQALEERLPSGQSRFDNQVGWARYYLVRGGYLDSSKRGVWALTEKGRRSERLAPAEVAELVRTVVSAWGRRTDLTDAAQLDRNRPPDEGPTDYREQLLSILQSLPASGFERLCQRLLREADFEQVNVTGRSGDDGIDGNGIVQVNTFVSFKVLFQCKRYRHPVGPNSVRDFRGAMMGRADKGLILTTATFTADAKREAVRDGVPAIELVDGPALVELFERLELGLRPRTTFDVDEAFFDEYRR